MVRLEITIPVASEWPTQQELNARNAVEDVLMDADVGEFVGAGGGLGQMDLCFAVADEKAARTLIDTAMKEHMPGAKYSVARLD